MTNQFLQFFRENLPHGREYSVGTTVMTREELAGYLVGTLVNGSDYEIITVYVEGKGEYDVVYSEGIVRINKVVLAEDGDYDWLPYATLNID